jgi:hypothetical protein
MSEMMRSYCWMTASTTARAVAALPSNVAAKLSDARPRLVQTMLNGVPPSGV